MGYTLPMPHLLFVNGALGGAAGNTARLLEAFARACEGRATVRTLHLADPREDPRPLLEWADGFAFFTGTYWDSWGSPLQAFLEQQTGTEATSLWLGKPAAVLVTMHSVGGKAVLSRLQGVLNTLGCQIPPMSGIVYSLVNQLALERAGDFTPDLWQLDDLPAIAHNLLASLEPAPRWQAWPVDREDPRRKWIRE